MHVPVILLDEHTLEREEVLPIAAGDARKFSLSVTIDQLPPGGDSYVVVMVQQLNGTQELASKRMGVRTTADPSFQASAIEISDVSVARECDALRVLLRLEGPLASGDEWRFSNLTLDRLG